jgi:hypothetical protein
MEDTEFITEDTEEELVAGCGVLGAGFWVLGSGFWVLGSEYWV